jgi:hypothetical protein
MTNSGDNLKNIDGSSVMMKISTLANDLTNVFNTKCTYEDFLDMLAFDFMIGSLSNSHTNAVDLGSKAGMEKFIDDVFANAKKARDHYVSKNPLD